MFYNGKENYGINGELQKPGSQSPSHKEPKSSHLRGQLEDNSLSCLILHQLMLWESGLVQCHVRIINPLTQQILEVSECHLGGPYGLQKKKKPTSPTCIPSATLFSNQPLPDYVGNNSCYGSRSTQPLHRANNTSRRLEAHDNNKTLAWTFITMRDTCILRTGTLTIPSALSPKRRSFSFKETATGVFLRDSLRREGEE